MVAENGLADMYNGKILYCMSTQIITLDLSSEISENRIMGIDEYINICQTKM